MLKQIAIVSGKGGTGKTTLSASFSYLANSRVMADCDVDAPNLHIILKPEVKATQQYVGSKKAILDQDKCIKCGICQKVCRFDAIAFDGEKYFVKEYACEGCNACVLQCPTNALELVDSLSGEYYTSETKNGPMTHALLKPGEETTGGLIAEVRKKAVSVAHAENIRLVIIDGAPGIGCPATSSITSTSYVVIVAEPTMSGLHDLKRIVQTVEHFRIPMGIVINKRDMNKAQADEIEKYCAEKSLEILGKIPYDVTVKTATEQAQPVILYECPAANEIKEIWSKIENRVMKG